MLWSSILVWSTFSQSIIVQQSQRSTIIEQAFTQSPTGDTPLASVLDQVFAFKLAERDHDKQLVVFLTADGDQGEDLLEQEKVMWEKTFRSGCVITIEMLWDVWMREIEQWSILMWAKEKRFVMKIERIVFCIVIVWSKYWSMSSSHKLIVWTNHHFKPSLICFESFMVHMNNHWWNEFHHRWYLSRKISIPYGYFQEKVWLNRVSFQRVNANRHGIDWKYSLEITTFRSKDNRSE